MAAYLKYDAIKEGESKAKGHEGSKGWIEINSVQLGVGRGISTPVGTSSKREASAPNISEIVVTKLLDSTSPYFFQEAVIGKACTAKIDLVETGSEAKPLIAGGVVRVNGEVETRRGRQLVKGDVVTVAGQSARVADESEPDDLPW